MKFKRAFTLIILLLIVIGLALLAAEGLHVGKLDIKPISEQIKLGLDIKGGVVLEYEAITDLTGDELREELNGTKAVMSTRIDSKGLMEPKITVDYAKKRIRVEMPGVQDVNDAAEFIGTTAKLTFHKVAEDEVISSAMILEGVNIKDVDSVEILDGSNVKKAGSKFINSKDGTVGYVVDLELDKVGADAFSDTTKEFVNRDTKQGQIAIAVDGKVISAPYARVVISDGKCIIENMSKDQAINLALQIKSGALPLELKEIQSSLIGPTLGQGALLSSIKAAIVGFILVILFMIIMYRFPGVIASFSLVLYATLILYAMVALNATLTLPGVAGIVLGIGMAVDANVVIFERIIEELKNGKTIRSSIKYGFKRALRTILDANITTLIAAIVLYIFGVGAIKGFATTLAIGIFASMFTAVFFTRILLINFDNLDIVKNKWLFGLNRVKENKKEIKLLKHHKGFLIASLSLIVLTIILFVSVGFKQGIDFKGGTSVQYDLKQTFDSNDVSEAIKEFKVDGKKVDFDIVKTGVNETEKRSVIIRSPESLSAPQREELENMLLAAYPDAEFGETSNFSPSVGSEIKQKAFIGVIIAAVGMLIYITFRFKLVYGLAAIAALVHDILVLLLVYLALRIPINSSFIAAVLTVVGYSINDTIVIFDRVRENSKILRRMSPFDIANTSIRQTIKRSINTSLTTILVIGSLYVLGVDSIKNLALPLLVGVVAGTYSSIFVATTFWAMWTKGKAKK